MAKHVKRSVVPIYLVGAVWLAYALLFPLYQPVHYLLCGALSAAAFIVGKGLFPNKVYEVPGEPEENKQEEPEKKEPPKSTGDPEIDALIKERDRAVGEMRRLNDSIEDEGISAQIDHLEEVTRKIIDLVVKQPKKLPQIRRFLDYYLPTTLKILNAYDRMDAAGISGENIDATKKKVEQMMARTLWAPSARPLTSSWTPCSGMRHWTSLPISPSWSRCSSGRGWAARRRTETEA